MRSLMLLMTSRRCRVFDTTTSLRSCAYGKRESIHLVHDHPPFNKKYEDGPVTWNNIAMSTTKISTTRTKMWITDADMTQSRMTRFSHVNCFARQRLSHDYKLQIVGDPLDGCFTSSYHLLEPIAILCTTATAKLNLAKSQIPSTFINGTQVKTREANRFRNWPCAKGSILPRWWSSLSPKK